MSAMKSGRFTKLLVTSSHVKHLGINMSFQVSLSLPSGRNSTELPAQVTVDLAVSVKHGKHGNYVFRYRRKGSRDAVVIMLFN